MKNKKHIAFVVGEFPVVSETFIINQVADLLDEGIEVTIFSFRKGSLEHVSERYHTHDMGSRTYYLQPPRNKILRTLGLFPLSLIFLFKNPRALLRASSTRAHGEIARSLYTFYWAAPFIGKTFDLIHCHFGSIANKYLVVRDIVGTTTPIVTSFYGYDVSHLIQEKGVHYYDRLKSICNTFFVMSENMKSRVVALGIQKEHVHVLPVSIDVDAYEYHARSYPHDDIIRLVSVGRFVEKKGFDDLFKAISLVKQKTKQKFSLAVVGDGELKDELHDLSKKLDIDDVVDYKGFMKIEEVFDLYRDSHAYIQTSKTASDGDME